MSNVECPVLVRGICGGSGTSHLSEVPLLRDLSYHDRLFALFAEACHEVICCVGCCNDYQADAEVEGATHILFRYIPFTCTGSTLMPKVACFSNSGS